MHTCDPQSATLPSHQCQGSGGGGGTVHTLAHPTHSRWGGMGWSVINEKIRGKNDEGREEKGQMRKRRELMGKQKGSKEIMKKYNKGGNEERQEGN